MHRLCARPPGAGLRNVPIHKIKATLVSAATQLRAPPSAVLPLKAQGWTDSVRARYPDERIYTFWDYFRQHWQKNSGLRIDHLLLSADLAPRLRDAGVDRWVRNRPHASDHAPTWIELDIGGEVPRRDGSRHARRHSRTDD
jgi:exonuclease III